MFLIPKRALHLLGIESSCDDTGVAIIDHNGKVLSNCVHSQLQKHLSMGGIIPVIAKDFHLENIDSVARRAFRESKLESVGKSIDAIAVTNRPGLTFSLQIGLNYAKALARKYSKPLIPIHHMQAHALMPLLNNRLIKFPFICLLISGGHCIVSVAKRYNDFHIVGRSHDEAPGDMLDKFARRMRLRNLGPPFDRISGGAAIELLARDGDRFKYFEKEEVPMTAALGCDFSFSGYRNCFDFAQALVDGLWSSGDRLKLRLELSHLCASLQRLVLIQFVKRLYRAVMFYKNQWRPLNTDAYATREGQLANGFGVREIDDLALDLVVSGGVATNQYFSDGIKLASRECIDSDMIVHTADKELCSDNGLMIAWNGLLRYQDFLSNEASFNNCTPNESVITDLKILDSVEVSSIQPMGLDLGHLSKLVGYSYGSFNHPEFKTNTCRN